MLSQCPHSKHDYVLYVRVLTVSVLVVFYVSFRYSLFHVSIPHLFIGVFMFSLISCVSSLLMFGQVLFQAAYVCTCGWVGGG